MDLFEDIRCDQYDITLAVRGVSTDYREPSRNYVTRVSGGLCGKCGYDKLATGECAVCKHRTRVQHYLRKLVNMRAWRKRRSA